jgi:ParB/RepB/Spo0J family partition protein
MREAMKNKINKQIESGLDKHPDVKKKIEITEDLKAAGQIVEIPVKDILDDTTFQIRTESISKEDFESLKSSIQKHGLKVPIFVRRAPMVEGKYQVIAGFNRLRACKELNIKTIKAIFNDIKDEEAYVVSEIENLIRTQLSFFDMLCYIKKLETRGLSSKDIAERLDKHYRTINLYKQIGEHEKLTNLVKDGKINFFEATRLIKLPIDDLNRAVNKIESRDSKEETKSTVKKSTEKPPVLIDKEKGTIKINLVGTIKNKEAILKELKKIIIEIEKAEEAK